MNRTALKPGDTRDADLKSGRPVFKQFSAEIESVADRDRCIKFTITTSFPDRESDVVYPDGIDIAAYQANPIVLFGHDYKSLPIGRCISIERFADRLVATTEFATADLNPLADQVFRMVKAGFLKGASIGFRPLEWVYDEERHGVNFKKTELLEFSIVPVPANALALVAARAAGIDMAVLKDWAQATLSRMPSDDDEDEWRADDPIRWNPQLSKVFDVDGEPLEASRLEYTWASRFLETPVKDLYETTVHVCSARMGSYLSALEESLAHYQTDSVRNLSYGSKEVPPVYETIQLNSTQSRSFLIEGMRFVRGPMRLVVKVEPSWSGVDVTVYGARAGSSHIVDFLAVTGQRSRQYKFLKGEAFALSGEFLARTEIAWQDLFLAPINLDPLKRTIALLNERGAAMESRGIILMGPPGTGKTLAGRVMMRQAPDATFIWASARDFGRMGSFGGLELAYDLASENAPSIVFLEDIDSWVDSGTVDLLKTQLDGLQQRTGIVTVLTTNFPEQLPKALIDRPGRFHDVLQLDLPSLLIREQMLAAWIDTEIPATVLNELATQTAGFSGAHIRELVRFAATLRSQDGLDAVAALRQALEKVKSQRELIDALHVGPRTFRSVASKSFAHSAKNGRGVCDRCGSDGSLAVGVCGPCASALHPWDGEAAVGRVAQFATNTSQRVDVKQLDPGEEAAELVGYQALQSLLAQLATAVKTGQQIVADLIADETENPAETDADEAGEEAVETARIDALLALAAQANGTLQCICSLAMALREDDDAAQITPSSEIVPMQLSRRIVKEGRVLSRSNENKLKEARRQLDEVLSAVEATPVDPEPTSAVAADIVLEFADAIDADPGDLALTFWDDGKTASVSEEFVVVDGAMIGDAIQQALGAIVRDETRAAINALRGRVD